MDSSAQPDRLSSLPDVVLIMIISCLPFKDCVKTSTLSKRWKSLYRETRAVAFKESDFVSPSLYGDSRLYARIAFLRYAYKWIASSNDQPIHSFEISMSSPEVYLEKINSLVTFAVRKKVKKLVLDFSHPTWRSFRDVKDLPRMLGFEVPESVYGLNTLESLKLWACKKFEPWRFVNQGIFKNLSLGYMRLPNLESFLRAASKLESFSINRCWDVMKIAGNMRELVIEDCSLFSVQCSFYMPRVEIFKYSGDAFYLQFLNIDRNNVKEVHLDFGVYDEYNQLMGTTFPPGLICQLLNVLPPTRTLVVCQYLLQVFQSFECPFVFPPVKTQHLILKTRLYPKEFNGIRFLLNNCPDLETLTFDMLPPSSIVIDLLDPDFDPQTYWVQNITDNNWRKTLKAVVVRNFIGGPNELNMVKYFILSQCEGEIVLENVELYVSYGLEESQKTVAYAGVEMLQRISKHVQVLVHNS
ncbi:unnamed protein product [Eruca vesicaria subsp. sativa]|uniref:F-box domain-containing protein n=1 Tax=Eruca vesicaria subsp. sativa TaxID=29727 RepID=A0ABC8M2I5_ERUVS|nr:unnamed protein product [Eruca vesicaria subsp. sativa]